MYLPFLFIPITNDNKIKKHEGVLTHNELSWFVKHSSHAWGAWSTGGGLFFTCKFWFAEGEWDVAIAYHVLKWGKIVIQLEKQLYKPKRLLDQLTLICLFMVIQKSVMKYMTNIGQNTGILKSSKKVQPKAITVALVAEYQNLNSGKRLMKGLNSSFCFVGSSNPSSSSASSWAMAGSILGVKKAKRRLRW